ncbi:Membrane-bound acyltransferase YfiQ, involved in biofilm formation [Tindallia magadiensis]|uniref:Membrane-bound acyltransferase YfiQ, involved in biofilm formation n=1 Tax=Tindallia magadiensis TaxID=69895 RepID=A0A1I3ET96_9FIRM|nr:acyltransferase family protein [Tindallia magadiensis]SFI01871.1 Membrane-bound acyltransferase YfiQ, involved in biofilm formation [Tindallia magadiensis]
MKKKRIEELHFIRSIACLCVVFVHSMTRVVEIHEYALSESQITLLMTLRLLFTFGTPIFIFLSEFLISYAYGPEVPKHFLRKRAQYILIPYVSMSVLYAVIMVHESRETLISEGLFSSFLVYIFQNLFFGFYNHGFFIVVIFQFYLLHQWLGKWLEDNRAKLILPISLAVNLLYLSYFNMTPYPDIAYGEYVWRALSWVPFPSWLFYFTLGYYGGRNFEVLKEKTMNMGKKSILAPILAGMLVFYFYSQAIITEDSSRRIDIVFLSTSMIFILFRQAFQMKRIPIIFHLLNKFSFGIYLLHMFFLYWITYGIETYRLMLIHPIVTLVLLFAISTVGSILATDMISRFSFGFYIVGKKPDYHWRWYGQNRKQLHF